MPKAGIPIDDFMQAAGPEHSDFINELHAYMTDHDCKLEIKQAASGYLASYIHEPSKRTVANYVFRKQGLMLRVYANNVRAYLETLTLWPKPMKDKIKGAGPCKRLLDPEDCNPKCAAGYDFVLDGERQQKCRYNGFVFYLDDETKPHLKEMIKNEIGGGPQANRESQ